MTGAVTSADGTTLGYHRFGRGPGLVVLHGAFESALSHQQLGEALGDAFTVTLPDRRGRGLSGPFGPSYGLQREVEDLAALLADTAAERVVGVSSGAIVCLQAALALPAIRKAVIFEPPIEASGPDEGRLLARFESELSENRLPAALVTAMQAARMGPAIFGLLPRWLLERLTRAMMTGEEKHAKSGDVTVRRLAPTLRYDFQLAIEGRRSIESLSAIRAELLLLGGSRSPAYLRAGLDTLAKLLPTARRATLAGVGHGALGNANRGGRPERAAAALREFLA